MREVAFIRQNKAKWLENEAVIAGKVKKNPDELSSLYINLLNDLAFSQTYYPKSSTTVYLNHLSSMMFQRIYKTKRVERNRISQFFLYEVPLLMFEYRRYLYFTILLFLAFVMIGVVSTKYDPDFVRHILGDGYVNMTLENIEKGNPTGVYGTRTPLDMALAIIFNNLMVGAKLYVYGVFAGLGTLFILMQNAVMVGTFQYFFETQDVLAESAKAIWLHGTFEILGMVVEAAAGFILGASMLFPKTFSRINSFKTGFKNSFKIYLSAVPLTIIAGIIEGFVTRLAPEMPLPIILFIILGSLGFMIFYYIIYPRKVAKKINYAADKTP